MPDREVREPDCLVEGRAVVIENGEEFEAD